LLDTINIVLLLLVVAVIAGTTVMLVAMRKRLMVLTDELQQARLALEGADNRLSQARDRMALLSNTDPVTGLLVRHVIVERFQLSLALAHAQGTPFGIILVQLTDFEHVADLHGRVVADKLLTVAAERLQAATSETDTVGRVREHEFAMLVPILRSVDELASRASRLHERLTAPVSVPGLPDVFRLAVHVGSATYPRDGENWPSLLKAVDERLRASRMQMS